MKKVLSTVAALGLVAGLASTASAVEFKVSGSYVVDGIYLDSGANNGFKLTETTTEDNSSNSWFMHTFQINPTLKVNDKITMNTEIRLADNTVWGSQAKGDTVQNNSNIGGDVYVHRFAMDYASPIGKLRIGRAPAGPYGHDFLSSDIRQDRIMWWPTFLPKPFSALFLYAKLTDNEYNKEIPTAEDSDRYEARLYYKTDAVDAAIRYYTHNASSASGAFEDEAQHINPYAIVKFDNYFGAFETQHKFGSQSATKDYDGMAAMLTLGGKFDALTVSGMYFYASGDNNAADNDVENVLGSGGTGTAFSPLYILTGQTAGLLNNDFWIKQDSTSNGSYTAAMSAAGVQAYLISADYAVSDRLTLHGAVGYAKADEKPTTTLDDEYGWEYNLGAAYKLLDNLTYEAHFGYLDTGDFFNGASTTDVTNNVYMLTHHLTMTF